MQAVDLDMDTLGHQAHQGPLGLQDLLFPLTDSEDMITPGITLLKERKEIGDHQVLDQTLTFTV